MLPAIFPDKWILVMKEREEMTDGFGGQTTRKKEFPYLRSRRLNIEQNLEGTWNYIYYVLDIQVENSKKPLNIQAGDCSGDTCSGDADRKISSRQVTFKAMRLDAMTEGVDRGLRTVKANHSISW